MKLAVYSKAGQVGLTEIDRPQIIEADDAIIRTYGATAVQILKQAIKIVGTKQLELSKKSGMQ